jgi:hypothetical protein
MRNLTELEMQYVAGGDLRGTTHNGHYVLDAKNASETCKCIANDITNDVLNLTAQGAGLIGLGAFAALTGPTGIGLAATIGAAGVDMIAMSATIHSLGQNLENYDKNGCNQYGSPFEVSDFGQSVLSMTGDAANFVSGLMDYLSGKN